MASLFCVTGLKLKTWVGVDARAGVDVRAGANGYRSLWLDAVEWVSVDAVRLGTRHRDGKAK
jgi:hypothetical protein